MLAPDGSIINSSNAIGQEFLKVWSEFIAFIYSGILESLDKKRMVIFKGMQFPFLPISGIYDVIISSRFMDDKQKNQCIDLWIIDRTTYYNKLRNQRKFMM